MPATTLKNILTFDVEDWPQSTLDFSLPITRKLRANTHRILDLVAAARPRATFFVLCLAAEALPYLVRRIRDDGHELASYGYLCRLVYGMHPQEFRDVVRRSVGLIQDAAGVRVLGYRAPDFSIRGDDMWAL